MCRPCNIRVQSACVKRKESKATKDSDGFINVPVKTIVMQHVYSLEIQCCLQNRRGGEENKGKLVE